MTDTPLTQPRSNDAERCWSEICAAHRPGHALPRAAYMEPSIFPLEMDRFLGRHWFCAGHVSSVRGAGDFFQTSFGGESIIIVRDRDGALNALLNVCRHRGSRVCTTARGTATAGRFVCPYHAWTYGLDGKLLAARNMPPSFDAAEHGLRRLPVEVVSGLIFVTLSAQPLGLAHVREALAGGASAYGWADARVAHQETYRVNANWKLAVENYMECYHCQPAHPEYARRHSYSRPMDMNAAQDAAAEERARAMGIDVPPVDYYGLAAADGEEAADAMRSALLGDGVTASQDGRPLAPLMGRFKDYDGSTTFLDVGPVSNFLAYPDHGVVYRFVPVDHATTELEVIWLVHADAVEGRDYDLARLVWLWRVTSEEDKRIIEYNQAGVSSRFFTPGPYSLQEAHALRFVDWYRHEMATARSVSAGSA